MKKRYVIYIGVLLLILFGGILGKDPVSGFINANIKPLDFTFSPVLPVIQLPGEVVFPWAEGSPLIGLFGQGLTNTFMAACLAFTVVLLIAVILKPRSRTADEVPTGFYNLFELIYEIAFNYVERSTGKWTKNFFPFFMTFILWILISNWLGLVPGFDSVGFFEDVRHLEAENAQRSALADGASLTEAYGAGEAAAAAVGSDNNEALKVGGIFLMTPRPNNENKNPPGSVWGIVPFFRPAASDLNFTLAIAIIAVIMTQFYGMRAQGYKYWAKFFPFFPFDRHKGDDIAKSPLAVMDIGVGLLEFISEVFKIVSFAFRLLGNIFAGMVLLFVIAALFPVANLAFYFLEFGVGALQAGVFALLTLTFMAGATQHH